MNVVLDFTELAMIISLVLKDVTISTNVKLGELTVIKMQNALILLAMVCIVAIVIQDRCHIPSNLSAGPKRYSGNMESLLIMGHVK